MQWWILPGPRRPYADNKLAELGTHIFVMSAIATPQFQEITSATAYLQLFKKCGSATAYRQSKFFSALRNLKVRQLFTDMFLRKCISSVTILFSSLQHFTGMLNPNCISALPATDSESAD
jgi:hypothetical protein